MNLPFRRLVAGLLMSLALPALAQEVQALKWINLRAGPARDYPLVAQFPPDSMLMVQGCTDGYAWCDVIGPTGARGWVYAGNLQALNQGQAWPLLGAGAGFGIPVIGFALGTYWGSYYQGQPWYGRRQEWRGRDVDRGNRPPRGVVSPNRPAAPPPEQRQSAPPSPGQIRPRGMQAQPAGPGGPPPGSRQAGAGGAPGGAPAGSRQAGPGGAPGGGHPGGAGGAPGGGHPGGPGGSRPGGPGGGDGNRGGGGDGGRDGGGHR